MKYKHIKLISLLIDYLTVNPYACDVNTYLIAHGIRYPERDLRDLTLEIQERLGAAE